MQFLARSGLHGHGEHEEELAKGDDALALLVEQAEDVLDDDLRF